MDFPFRKGGGEAARLSRWIEKKINDRRDELELADDVERMKFIQGQIAQLRDILAECHVSELELGQISDPDTSGDLNQPIDI